MVCQLDFPNNPFRQFPKTHYSSPALAGFQHSNWGEAPKFYILETYIYDTTGPKSSKPSSANYAFTHKSICLNFGSTNVGEAKNHMNKGVRLFGNRLLCVYSYLLIVHFDLSLISSNLLFSVNPVLIPN